MAKKLFGERSVCQRLSMSRLGTHCLQKPLFFWPGSVRAVAQRLFLLFAVALAGATPPPGLAAAMPAVASPATPKVTFRGTEYFLRTSQGNQYEFTPAGQEDQATFTEELTLNLYPAAHDQNALATITSRVRDIAVQAKGTIVRTTSVPASGQQPGEHYVAAVLPTSHGADFDAARFTQPENGMFRVFFFDRASR
jgi:hypothetical protein